MFCSILACFSVKRLRQTTLSLFVVHCVCEVNNSLFLYSNIPSSPSCVHSACLYFWFVCVWGFAAKACLLCFCSCLFIFFFAFCSFEFYIFNIPTHKNSTNSSPQICNSCTQHITILHFAHKHHTHPICCVSRNYLHRSMTMVVLLLLLLLLVANDDYAVSLSLQNKFSTLRNIHSLFFFRGS